MYDPPSGEPSGEFIELYNRGTAAVDVSGWQFVEGVSFTIPAKTTIPKDGYLVVAADANWVQATYGNIPVVGDFDGHLSQQGRDDPPGRSVGQSCERGGLSARRQLAHSGQG